MVRTKPSGVPGAKSLGAKAPRKLSLSSSNSRSKSKSKRDSNSQSGGNAICPRETPQWQKPITNFFNQNSGTISHDNENTSSLNTDDKEIIPVEYCSVELNDSTVHDDAENITAIDDDQKDNVPSVEHYERNAKRKKDQTSSKDEGIDSEEEGIAIKRIKFSNVQTDSDATP